MGFVISAKRFSLVGACAINFALFFLSMPGLFWVVWTRVTETSHGTSLVGYVPGVDDGDNSSRDDRQVTHIRQVVANPVSEKGV